MRRERVLQVVLVVVGVLFTAGIYPLAMRLLYPQKCEYSDVMLLSLYVTLGIFLLVAVRSPSAYRSLIAFAAWSSLAHAIVMGVQALPNASMRGDLYGLGCACRHRCSSARTGSGKAVSSRRIGSHS
jgi:hypothetical protein